MIRRWRQDIAWLMALVIGLAGAACACGVAPAQAKTAAVASVDPHACCKTPKQTPRQHEPTRGECPHCGHLTVVPAKSPDRAPDMSFLAATLAPASPRDALVFVAPISFAALAVHSTPSSTLLGLSCALTL
jgi:hypothetical protein